MATDRDLIERVCTLENQWQNEREARQAQAQKFEQEIARLESRVQYFDKMALKWGFFCLGFLSFGAALWAGVDKLKDKLLERIL